MKVQYLVLLVALVLEASLWFVSAAGDAETLLVKPARQGKSPRKIKRTIRVRESQPPPLSSAPVAPVQQPAAPAQPISNRVDVKPEISVSVSPHQQQHSPQPAVQATTPARPIVVQQQPIVELPDDEPDKPDNQDLDDDDDDDDDAGDEHRVRADSMQIVPYEKAEQSIVPVSQLKPEMVANPGNELVELSRKPVELIVSGNEDTSPDAAVFQLDGAKPNNSVINNIPYANIINRRHYRPLGWPVYTSQAAPAVLPGLGVAPLAGQLPVIQVNIDEQVREPWLLSPASGPALVQSPIVQGVPSSPMVAAPAPGPIWQQPGPVFYPSSPLGSALAAAANVYQPPGVSLYQPAAYSGSPLFEAPRVRAYYGSVSPTLVQQPLMVAPALLPPPPVSAPQTVLMQPLLMQPSALRVKGQRKKDKEPADTKQVVVKVEEPLADQKKTTWVKEEPQFNQFVEEKKLVEVPKPKEPEEIEWETVRIPKIKTNAASGQQ